MPDYRIDIKVPEGELKEIFNDLQTAQEAPLEAKPTSSAKVITVIETISVIGSGTPDDPLRHMIRYWSLEGDLLAEHDTINDGANLIQEESH